MMQFILIGLGAGVVSALSFAVLKAGAALSMLLFYLTPLPIMIAALGWSHWAGLLAILTGTAALATLFTPLFCLVFLIGIGLPAWWLCYLALLARPTASASGPETEDKPQTLDWYPTGRLVLWAAVLGAIAVAVALPTFGTDAETVRATLRDGFARAGADGDRPLVLPGIAEPNTVYEFLAIVLPPGAAALMTFTLLLNLWLAGRAVAVSGRLAREWPRIADLSFPPSAAGLFLLAAGGASFLPGMAGLVALLFAASFAVAFAAVGLATVHSLTQPLRARRILLTTLYAAILLFGWPIVLVALFGFADTAFGLRSRFPGNPPPSAGIT